MIAVSLMRYHFVTACSQSFHLICVKDSDKCPGLQATNEDENPYDTLAKVCL